MSDAANLYADSLHTDKWQIEVKNDIQEIFTNEPRGARSNREMAERHTAIVDLFVAAVKRALINHAFDISHLDRVTQWRFGEIGRGTQIENGLTSDEADNLLHKMSKQGFRVQYFPELCSNLYTVLAYKDEASQTMPQGMPTGDEALPEISGELYNEWHTGRCYRVLLRLEQNGFISKSGKVYDWKIDTDNEYTNNLFVYFVFIACEKFEWLKGSKQQIQWKKFYPMFPNMKKNRGALDQYIREVKAGSYPIRATEIDNLFDW